jgi:hypothetical protein
MARIGSLFLVSFCLVVLLSSPSRADGRWYGDLVVTAVVAHVDCYLINTSSTSVDCETQGPFSIMASHLMAKDMYAMALAALLGNKLIDVYVPATNECHIEGVVATILTIKKD